MGTSCYSFHATNSSLHALDYRVFYLLLFAVSVKSMDQRLGPRRGWAAGCGRIGLGPGRAWFLSKNGSRKGGFWLPACPRIGFWPRIFPRHWKKSQFFLRFVSEAWKNRCFPTSFLSEAWETMGVFLGFSSETRKKAILVSVVCPSACKRIFFATGFLSADGQMTIIRPSISVATYRRINLQPVVMVATHRRIILQSVVTATGS